MPIDAFAHLNDSKLLEIQGRSKVESPAMTSTALVYLKKKYSLYWQKILRTLSDTM